MNLALIRKNKNCRCRTVQFSATALSHAKVPAVLIISFEHTKKQQVLESSFDLENPERASGITVVHSEPMYFILCLPLLQNLQSMLLVNSTCALDPIFSLASLWFRLFSLSLLNYRMFSLYWVISKYIQACCNTSHLKGKKIP